MRKDAFVPLLVLFAACPLFAEAVLSMKIKIDPLPFAPIFMAAAAIMSGLFFCYFYTLLAKKKDYRTLFFLVGVWIFGGLASTIASNAQGLPWPSFIGNIFGRGIFISIVPLFIYIVLGTGMNSILHGGMTMGRSIFVYWTFSSFFIFFSSILSNSVFCSPKQMVLLCLLSSFIPVLATILIGGYGFIGFLRSDWKGYPGSRS